MDISDDIKYIGVNDHDVDLFEGQYVVPLGMAYNSYLVKDEKTVVFDLISLTKRFMRPSTSSLGRFQFSVENA